ncbi:hypothetical protein M23134_00040 [Microscilla marina ATCC 23134]|uniref:Uncharacterized protein n=1 Tax=Microscilla marina ATCC 23134 TaxID=313606 RepID=A1ZKS0_MICM2|nr:hypothetical protein M23134_00040 [Microscilla marina ATCC 23134]
MPKLPTFPTLYDNALQFSTIDLKRLGILNPNSLLFKSPGGKQTSQYFYFLPPNHTLILATALNKENMTTK